SYEVIVNGYFEMHIDPLDPYAQLVIEASPLPEYIPGPKAPPSPDYIPGPEYPEYLPPADDVFPAEEQLLPAAVSPTAKSGDDDADDDSDDFSEDDTDDEDKEDSSDSEEEEEEHLASTVPAPTLHKSEVERLLAIPTPPLSLVSPTSYPLPSFLMPLPIFTPLPPPPPIILPRTRASMKRARFTTPTSGYKVGESSVVVAARQIRPALIVDDSRRAEDRLIGRLRRESTLVTPIEALQRDVSTLQGQQIDDGDRLTRHIQHEHAQRDAAPEDGDSSS
nr:hypothetical protein [Tanacetum cinerariifolium]